ncbi:MAG: beta-glucosidase [Nocardioidaceae bacterium]|nr:beta-glucosidase [Nocardioidaceae bacterium]
MVGDVEVERIVRELTLEEKASLVIGSDFWHTAAVERLDVPRVMVADGPHGLRKQPDDPDHTGAFAAVPATCFPTAAALASSWDPDLARRVGEALGRETRAEDVAVLLGPGVNIKRSPLCGRNFEYFSEDPLLAGVLASAMVQGVQSQGVGTSLKHYAANNQETDRVRVSADVDERTLREIYLPAFERVVTEAAPWTVMCSYNRLNGLHVSQHPGLLTDVLRGEWGFEGVVVSDWGAVHDRVAALEAGLDLEMPPQLGWSDRAVVDAVRAGTLDEKVLDRSVRRMLELVRRSPAPYDGPPVDHDAHHALAREVARDCAVLLKNDGGLLPLDLASGAVLGVVGEPARTPRFQGAGSSQVTTTRVDVPLDELGALAPEGVEVAFAPGFDPEGPVDDDLAAEAEALARRADVVVVFLGLPASYESEGFDRTHLHLPSAQVEVLDRVARANPRVAVVLANGSAVLTSPWQQQVPAILECWLSGQAAGGAVADLLLGSACPSGRLAETIPVRLEDTPSYLNFPGEEGHVRYGEGVFVGYRGHDALGQPVAFPFGHGLTYTTFEYHGLEVDVTGDHADGTLAVSATCRVTNTGERAGQEVVQLYVQDVDATVARPPRELRGFTKLDLGPGQSGTATFALSARDLSYWSERVHGWVLEAGEFEVAVGASSRDLRLSRTVYVDAPRVAPPLGPMSSLQEWLDDPEAAAMLRQALGVDPDGRLPGMLGDPQAVDVVGNFPLRGLAGFPNVPLDHATVDAMLGRLSGTGSSTSPG